MQTKTKKALSASTIASLLITSSVVSVNVKAATVTPPESPRLWGADRYETAVKVSQTGWTSGSDYAILASGEGYADALCAAPLAKANNAPILLTQKGELNSNTLKELKRLNVKHVFIVGGQGVVSQEVENKIKTEVTSDIQRLWGQNRYETSVKVAQKLGTPSKIVLASGEGYADALSAAPVAAIEGMPILLTESKTLSKATSDYIKSNTGITKTYVIGGYASVSDTAMNAAPSAQRISGADRYETNVAVINSFASDFDFKNVYVALGNGPVGNEFADALTASAIAAKNKNPLVIVGKELSSATQTLLKSKLLTTSTITVLGGTANVSDSLVSQIRALPTATAPSGGSSSGGSGGGIVSNGTYLNKAGTYTNNISGDAYITASDVILKGNVGGNLYIQASNTTSSGITVGGTVYVNPGANGEATLENVTAKNIVVQSGAAHTIKFKGVKADKLTVDSSSNVRIESEGTTVIKETEIKTSVILQADSGSFGNINILKSGYSNTVELNGSFDRPILVLGNVKIIAKEGSNIPAIVIPENVNAPEINLEGLGTISDIQVRSKGVVLNIGSGVVVSGKIEAADKRSVKSDNATIIGKVEEKPADQMNDITSYEDITKMVSNIYANKIAGKLENYPNLKNYFTVTTGSAITVQLNKQGLNSLSTAFDRTQAQDLNTIKDKLTKAQQQINLHSSYIKIDGLTVKQFLAGLHSQYINSAGELNVDDIALRIKNNTLTYDQFKQHLHDRIEATYNTSNNSPKLKISYDTFSQDITSIYKDGSIIYSSSLSREANITNLLNLGDSTTGTYTVYCRSTVDSGNKYFTVTVLPAK